MPVQQLGQGGGTGLGAGTRAEVGLVPAGGITGNKVRKVLYLVEQNSHILVHISENESNFNANIYFAGAIVDSNNQSFIRCAPLYQSGVEVSTIV